MLWWSWRVTAGGGGHGELSPLCIPWRKPHPSAQAPWDVEGPRSVAWMGLVVLCLSSLFPQGKCCLNWGLSAMLGSFFWAMPLHSKAHHRKQVAYPLSRAHPDVLSVLVSSAIQSPSADKPSNCDEQNLLHNQ